MRIKKETPPFLFLSKSNTLFYQIAITLAFSVFQSGGAKGTHTSIAFVCDSIMAESYGIGRKAIRQTKMLPFGVRSLPPLTLLSSYNEVG